MDQVTASLPDGTRFPFFIYSGTDRDRFISVRIRRRGSWEPLITAMMLSLLEEGDLLLDIGANIGWYSVAAALKVGAAGQVIAFEPDPDNADMLERNVAVNSLGNVRVHRCALAASTGQMKLIKSATNMGDHRLDSSGGAASSGDAASAVTVPIDTLDRLAAIDSVELSRARILKLDTQGAEVLVLRGARATLAALPDRCAIFVEFSPNLLRRHGKDGPEVFIDWVRGMDRSVYLVHSRYRTIHPVSPAELTAFAQVSHLASEDAGLDLILAPRGDAAVAPYQRFYAPWVKSKLLRIVPRL